MKQVLRAGETMATTTTEMVVSTVRKIRETMAAMAEAVVVEDAAVVVATKTHSSKEMTLWTMRRTILIGDPVVSMTIATQTTLLTEAETEVETHTLVTEVTEEVVKVLTTIETTTISRKIPASREVVSRVNTKQKAQETRTMVVAQEV